MNNIKMELLQAATRAAEKAVKEAEDKIRVRYAEHGWSMGTNNEVAAARQKLERVSREETNEIFAERKIKNWR
jgi:hypothetical protein